MRMRMMICDAPSAPQKSKSLILFTVPLATSTYSIHSDSKSFPLRLSTLPQTTCEKFSFPDAAHDARPVSNLVPKMYHPITSKSQISSLPPATTSQQVSLFLSFNRESTLVTLFTWQGMQIQEHEHEHEQGSKRARARSTTKFTV